MNLVDYSLVKFKNDIEKYHFEKVYKSIHTGEITKLDRNEQIKLLELAILFINSNNENLFNLGYFIIVNYSIETSDYLPLFDISEKMLNYPIVKFINSKELVLNDDNFFTEISYSVMDLMKSQDGYYYAGKQKYMNDVFFNNDVNISVTAPTSFGKTEIIKKYIKNNYKTKTICLLEPTKSLLNQVRNDILKEFDSSNKPKIITHYDMNFSEDDNIVLIMTQERLFKLLFDRKRNISIDVLIVDEAHNIFGKDERSFLLAKIILLLRNINNKILIKYFSPVVDSVNNLKLRNDTDCLIKPLKVKPYIKIEKYYYYDCFQKSLFVYDQFLNNFYLMCKQCCNDKFRFIKEHSSSKNLIYLNRPKTIKEEVLKLERELEEVNSLNIDKICKNLSLYINKDYDLIDCIKKGIVYHFGTMPDNVRNYIEKCVKDESQIKYIFCTSTLLEGVNMPFDKLFILDLKKGNSNLSFQNLKNLVGRVNRYNNIFSDSNESLNGLISNVYFIKWKNENDRFDNFMIDNLKVVSKSKLRSDVVQNALLENSKEELKKLDYDIIENLKLNNENDTYEKIKTDVGRMLIDLNVTDFNIFKYEDLIQNRINSGIVDKNDTVMDMIYKLFINGIDITSENELLLKRLQNQSARNFYNMMLKWRKENISFNESVLRLVSYWDRLSIQEKSMIFVGKSFGEIRRTEFDHVPLYVNLNSKSKKEIINLAIIRIKEENDYIDYHLIKYIDFLQKQNLITNDDYNLIHYGTVNELEIFFQREGLSRELSRLLIKKYAKYIECNESNVAISKDIISVFNDNDVLKLELETYLS